MQKYYLTDCVKTVIINISEYINKHSEYRNAIGNILTPIAFPVFFLIRGGEEGGWHLLTISCQGV